STLHDGTYTGNLAVYVNLLNLVSTLHPKIADSLGVGTIVDTDAAPTLSIADASVLESKLGVVLTVQLSAVSGRDVTFNFATADGTALAGIDYQPNSWQLTIPAGQTSTSFGVLLIADH